MITKLGIGASYNDSGPLEKVLKEINAKAHEERTKSGITNHYFKRTREDPRTSKFNYSLYDIPIVVYTLMNALASDANHIAIVGDQLTGKITKHFAKFFETDYSKFTFVNEGTDWSLENTFRGLKEGLKAKPSESIAQISGDTPVYLDLNEMLRDPDAKDFDLVFDLNCRENIYKINFTDNKGPYNRRWHLPIFQNHGWKAIWVKEPNGGIWKFNDNTFNKINTLFDGRKSYGTQNKKGKLKGRAKLINEFFLKNGKWWKTLATAPRALAYLGLRKFTPFNVPLFDFNRMSKIASYALEAPVLIKGKHSEWGRLADIDSAEDLAFFEALMHSAEDPSQIYPYFNEIKRFTEYLKTQPDMQNEELIQDFHTYMNEWFEQFPLLKGKQLYDDKGTYIGPKLDKTNVLNDKNNRNILSSKDSPVYAAKDSEKKLQIVMDTQLVSAKAFRMEYMS
ncbi:MAG: hypothetical protein U9R08_04550 [Nanoarchaeota archaeon]|nr:hypothetical protein [Nanoarchaeota archaeon]